VLGAAGAGAVVVGVPGGGAKTAALALLVRTSARIISRDRAAVLGADAWVIAGRLIVLWCPASIAPTGFAGKRCISRIACVGARHRMAAMPPKQRQIKIEQRGAMQAIQALEQRSDEELEAEVKYKSAALAILGGRAAERFDAEKARGYFQVAQTMRASRLANALAPTAIVAIVATVMNVPRPIMKVDPTPTQNRPCANANTRTRIAPEHGRSPTAMIADNPRCPPPGPARSSGSGA